MKKFITRLGIFIGTLVLIYLGFFYFIDITLKKSKYQDLDDWNSIYNGTIDADVIIQGSSRAWLQIDPKIIEDKTNYSVYNLGMNGYRIPMELCRTKIYKQHNQQPQYIIQILDHFALKQRENLFHKMQFIPYLNDTILANQTQQYEGFSWANYNIPYFNYFGSKELVLAGFSEGIGAKKFDSPKYKGFASNDWEWEMEYKTILSDFPKTSIEVQDSVRVLLDDFVKESISENSKLVLVYTPDYIDYQKVFYNRDSIINIYASIAKENNILFLDYSNDTICKNPDYFYNPTHLNKTGAAIFTEKMTNDLSVKNFFE